MPSVRSFFASFFVLLSFVTTRPAAGCDAVPVVINSTFRSAPGGQLARQTFVVEVPGAGMVALDVGTPGAAVPRLRLESADTPCAGISPSGADLLAADPRRWVFAVAEAGEVTFAVATEDPALALPAFKLRVAFAAEPEGPGEVLTPAGDVPDQCGIALEGGASWLSPESALSLFSNEVDPWDCDIVIGHRPTGGALAFAGDGLPLHVTLWSGSCGTATTETARGALAGSGARVAGLAYADAFEVAIDSWAGSSGAYTLAVQSYDLCSPGEADDHGDAPLCATALKLGATLQGELASSFGDDEDFATLVLDATTAVSIELAGDGARSLTLADDHGQHLGHWTASAAEPLTATRTLAAGRYTLAVTQAQAREVSWELRVEETPD